MANVPPKTSKANKQKAGAGGEEGFREVLNKHPWVVAVVTLLFFGVCMAITLKPPKRPQMFFTSDNGQTFEVLDAQPVPFTRHGKEYDQAMVYSCDGGAHKFVGYVFRYTPEGKVKADAMFKRGEVGNIDEFEVMKPGSGVWVRDPGLAASAMAQAFRRKRL